MLVRVLLPSKQIVKAVPLISDEETTTMRTIAIDQRE